MQSLLQPQRLLAELVPRVQLRDVPVRRQVHGRRAAEVVLRGGSERRVHVEYRGVGRVIPPYYGPPRARRVMVLA